MLTSYQPNDDLDRNNTLQVLHKFIDFDLVGSREWSLAGNRKVVELSFASILGQSQSARRYLREKYQKDGVTHLYSVVYGPDPCET